MNPLKRLPRKAWLLVAFVFVASLWPLLDSSIGLTGPRDPRSRFLDAVAANLAKDPRVTVLRVDHQAGDLVLHVKTTNRTWVMSVAEVEPTTSGPMRMKWTWKDEQGKVDSFGNFMGEPEPGKNISVSVPGLQ